jgi:hypothetical protein
MRQRMTWSRKASAHPAYPDEGAASPAYPGADPGEHDYENGDTSSWAEDPTKGPYKPGAHPAYPDEGPASPAFKQAALERKAAKCIRIASAMLGKRASVKAIEDQALVFMDLDNRSIQASLARLAGSDDDGDDGEDDDDGEDEAQAKKANLRRNRRMASGCEECGEPEFMDDDEFASVGDEEAMLDELMLETMLEEETMGKYARLRRLAADEGEEESDEEAPAKAEKEARMKARLARLRRLAADEGDEESDEEAPAKAEKEARMKARLARLRRLAADEGDEESDEEKAPAASEKKASWGMEEEALLEQLMEEEGMGEPGDDALLEEEGMGEHEGMMPPLAAEEAESFEEDALLEDMLAEEDVPGLDDPMGVVDLDMSDDERFLMAKLFGKNAGEEPEAEEPKAEEPKTEKKASFRPQPRKTPNGVTRLGGGVTKEASVANDLSKLWDSAPDVSKYF